MRLYVVQMEEKLFSAEELNTITKSVLGYFGNMFSDYRIAEEVIPFHIEFDRQSSDMDGFKKLFFGYQTDKIINIYGRPFLAIIPDYGDGCGGVAIRYMNHRGGFVSVTNQAEYEAVAKIGAHEIGHVFGLKHHDNYDCLMRPSDNESDAEFMRWITSVKGFCASCNKKLQEYFELNNIGEQIRKRAVERIVNRLAA